ncbi:MAG: hypothetical protein HZB86_00520, partial [Deltaproteobacteria bacterium]|nr:hypothetical protein [Deltaproteobacteria bacterium]
KLATSEVVAELAAIGERIDSSTLEVVARNADRVETLEAANVTFRLAQPIGAEPFGANPRLGRFVIDAGGFVAGGGIVRAIRAGEHATGTRVVRLDSRLTTEPDGNFIDLSGEPGRVEFDLSPGFLDRLAWGNRVVLRLRTADQLEGLARLAFGHGLALEFHRDEGKSLATLYQRFPESAIVYDDSGPVI